MRIEDHIIALSRDGRRLAEAAERAGTDAAVPSCPGWRIRDLLGHVGGVHRWAASYVATGRAEPWPAEEETQFFPTVADADLVPWFQAGHLALVETLRAADAGLACWTFLRAPSPLAFWARRQAHETAIHRTDAESAVGAAPSFDPEFAVDGIDELLNGFFARPGGRLRADPPVSLVLRATDADAAWTVQLTADGRRVVDGEHPADVTVAGPASDLYLMLWNRADAVADPLEVRGNAAVLDLWRDRATVRWS